MSSIADERTASDAPLVRPLRADVLNLLREQVEAAQAAIDALARD